MIKHEIKSRLTGDVLFVAEIDCTENASLSLKIGLAVRWAVANMENLRGADLRGADLRGADLEGTDLEGANLRGADLRWAYLEGADLEGADLGGADLRGVHGPTDYIKCIQIDQYPITYTSEVIQIGCERHSIEDWSAFSDSTIAEMDGKKALKFWRKYKDWIFQTIELCPAKPTGEAK